MARNGIVMPAHRDSTLFFQAPAQEAQNKSAYMHRQATAYASSPG